MNHLKGETAFETSINRETFTYTVYLNKMNYLLNNIIMKLMLLKMNIQRKR